VIWNRKRRCLNASS